MSMTKLRELCKEEVQVCADFIGCPAAWVDGLIQYESGWNGLAENEKTKAFGLFQFLPSTMDDLGVSKDEFIKELGYELQFSTWRRFMRPAVGKISSEIDLYLYNFWPSAIINNLPDNHILSTKKLSAKQVYEANSVMDSNSDKMLTVSEAKSYIAKKVGLKKNGNNFLLLIALIFAIFGLSRSN